MREPFYRIVRVVDGVEEVVRDILWHDLTDRSHDGAKYAVRKGRSTQKERAEAFAEAERHEGHIRIYSSQDDGMLGPGDLIWDSELL